MTPVASCTEGKLLLALHRDDMVSNPPIRLVSFLPWKIVEIGEWLPFVLSAIRCTDLDGLEEHVIW